MFVRLRTVDSHTTSYKTFTPQKRSTTTTVRSLITSQTEEMGKPVRTPNGILQKARLLVALDAVYQRLLQLPRLPAQIPQLLRRYRCFAIHVDDAAKAQGFFFRPCGEILNDQCALQVLTGLNVKKPTCSHSCTLGTSSSAGPPNPSCRCCSVR